MDSRIHYVEETLGFMFEEGFAKKFEQLGSPQGDLEFWYRNAKVYRTITAQRPVTAEQRRRLVTFIEAIRLDAMCGALPDEEVEFDVSVYEFSEDLLIFKRQIIEEVLNQEKDSPSTIDPLPPEGSQVH